ncbi:hypothetical protein PC39_00955 [Salinisphaera sp. PC39]|uniref:DUF547 domain-containing protein n=1 Tax=Salinisphaera sp. PC39 TaxID=1304156 RepID=UPI0033401279
MPNRLIATLAGLALAGAAAAAPEAEPWPRWKEHDPTSEATIDHGAWSEFLTRYIEPDPALDLNRLRYGAVSKADRAALAAYIRRLEAVDIDAHNRDQQLAYWLNLYNAATVRLILEDYPVDSIRDLGGLFSSGPWDRKVVTVAGTRLTLNDIEHRILRPIWDTPLIHYGVNCASVGCPNLLKSAYTGAGVYRQLRDNARAYVNSPRGVRIEDGRVTASRIYDWYREDFGGSEAGVISHLRQYAAPALSARLDAAGEVDDYAYDWALNDAGGADD